MEKELLEDTGMYRLPDSVCLLRAFETQIHEFPLNDRSIHGYLRLSKSLGLEGTAIFLGEKRREELARILPACDLGVIPFDDDSLWLSAYYYQDFRVS